MNTLVERLSTGQHNVVLARTKTTSDFYEAIQASFVLITFKDTRGGTELGVRLSDQETRIENADFQTGKGTVLLVGSTILNYVEVTVRAKIELESLSGIGNLESVAIAESNS